MEASERLADGQVGEEDLRLAQAHAWAAVEDLQPAGHREVLRAEAAAVTPGKLWPWAARAAAESASQDAGRATQATQAAVERAGIESAAEGQDIKQAARVVGAAARAELLRDIFGNPFRTATVNTSWLTASVTALAQAIYEDRAFHWLPDLADALEEAGCTHPDVLAHCRQSGEHVRGCWVIDVLLGNE
ncbi:MAG TPA: hypothetical protein VG013_24640 [Gemmataceae bacterium]|nr:hypothetical protein [Gemmataceae bacterium]